jgi:hypothetical protein
MGVENFPHARSVTHTRHVQNGSAAKCCLSGDKRVSSPATDTIGVTAIPQSFVRHLASAANQLSSMVRPSSKMVMALLTSSPFGLRCGCARKASFSTLSICCSWEPEPRNYVSSVRVPTYCPPAPTLAGRAIVLRRPWLRAQPGLSSSKTSASAGVLLL